ncbi:DNA replication regulator Sld3 [Penicillium capsulatum]|uniref:DNA replication regulator Sld3 n=1 Tax=Penicillium capsulatum TaxID=69766 RepID=A0A9W9LF67_9EURO|nr:DNA replication regulator Sld3 [Penicillium capsulatum]KAJ6112876.1 DNA replication regulator Sld3 [Penicillium capsulatum]
MTAHAIPSALDPLSAFTLNKIHEPTQPPSKKRKFEEDSAAGQLATTSIVIRAHAASLSDEPLVLDPITALSRSRLPLSWLEDASWSHSDAQPGGLFVADIPALETDLRGCVEPTVLAARLTAHGGLYVIERVKRGIYSLSRLAPWVQEGDVVVAVKGWQGIQAAPMDIETDEAASSIPDAVTWWQAAQVEEPPSDLGLGDELAGLQVDVVFGPSEGEIGYEGPSFVDSSEHRSQSLALAQSFNTEAGPSFGALASQDVIGPDAMDVDLNETSVPDVKQTPEELFDGMREQYLQALYVSKARTSPMVVTSVAYFAKGPLTRCRNAFQNGDTESPQSPSGLIEFYREAILAAKKMDLKYREALPAATREAVLALSDGEDAPNPKKRKSKKKKLGKNGLYPEEEDFIRKWWKDRSMMESSTQETSREGETKKHISELRLRETQLQILLILEVIALESNPIDDTKAKKETAVAENKDAPKKSKAKKPQDLNVLLELHLDRLCIWHAVSMEESTAAESAKTSAFNEGHMSGKNVESDVVRDFCTEVVIPFYASRLPDKCKLITRKFGVSGGISPAAKKSQSSGKRPEPGSEIKRQQPAPKSRRSLHRVLTDEKTAAASQSRHPTLHRSNTAPSKQETNRDSMEPLLPMLVSGNVRGGIQQAKRAENREVDLNAVARQHESKLRKVQMLVDQKKELDAAIHTLRKPNRELVAQDIAEDVAKRVTTGGSSRKPKNPVRNPLGQGVQVMATPRGNRKKNTVVGLPPMPRSLAPSRSFTGEMQDDSLPESSPVVVPSSGRRAISFSGSDSNPFSSRRPVDRSGKTELGSIQETPTRPSSKLFSDSKSGVLSDVRQVPSSLNKGRSLFRVPNIPEPRSATADQSMVPTTPVSSRQKSVSSSIQSSSRQFTQSLQAARSSAIMETPPKQQKADSFPVRSVPFHPSAPVTHTTQPRAQSPPAVMGTPVKGAAAVPMTPEKPQSIYDQLGWDDDEMDL